MEQNTKEQQLIQVGLSLVEYDMESPKKNQCTIKEEKQYIETDFGNNEIQSYKDISIIRDLGE